MLVELLAAAGTVPFVFGWMYVFHVLKPRRGGQQALRATCALLFGISFAAYAILLAIAVATPETGTLWDKPEFLASGLVLSGMCFAAMLWGYVRGRLRPTAPQQIHLEPDEFQIVTQGVTPTADGVALPVGQDFPYVANYLRFVRDGREGYILFTSDVPRKNVGATFTVETAPLYADRGNVYHCIGVKYDSERLTAGQHLQRVMTVLLVGTALVAAGLLPLLGMTPSGEVSEGTESLIAALAMTFIGAASFKIPLIQGSKIIKAIFYAFGSLVRLVAIMSWAEALAALG